VAGKILELGDEHGSKLSLPFAFPFQRTRQMTFEEFNRAMEFIVQQQAAFSAKLDRDHEWARNLIGQLAMSKSTHG
jgi:hypothetical protein